MSTRSVGVPWNFAAGGVSHPACDLFRFSDCDYTQGIYTFRSGADLASNEEHGTPPRHSTPGKGGEVLNLMTD